MASQCRIPAIPSLASCCQRIRTPVERSSAGASRLASRFFSLCAAVGMGVTIKNVLGKIDGPCTRNLKPIFQSIIQRNPSMSSHTSLRRTPLKLPCLKSNGSLNLAKTGVIWSLYRFPFPSIRVFFRQIHMELPRSLRPPLQNLPRETANHIYPVLPVSSII